MKKVQYRHTLTFNPKQLFPEEEANRIIGFLLGNIIRADHILIGIPCLPGAIIASPSIPEDPGTDQNYVYDWTRDSAIVMAEIVHLYKTTRNACFRDIVHNYISFTESVQNHGNVALGYARWNLDASPSENWSVQNDGPALRAIVLLEALDALDSSMQQRALQCIAKDVDYTLRVYDQDTKNIWEEECGSHFFAKIVMRKLLIAAAASQHLPQIMAAAIAAPKKHLEDHLDRHWVASEAYYKSQLDAPTAKGNDVNAAVILGLLYGGTDDDSDYDIASAKGMRTLSKILRVFDPYFPINAEDAKFGLGPNLGRYPLDFYDGDISDPEADFGHPWFICTNAAACAFYRIAARAAKDPAAAREADAAFAHLAGPSGKADCAALGDRMVLTTKRHWDCGRMTEQYSRWTGMMNSVIDLSWSYATYLMCRRLRP